MEKLKIAELIKQRKGMYEEIKKELTPIIMNLIKEKSPLYYWDLFRELENDFGLSLHDYERVIHDLAEENLVQSNWISATGTLLRIKNGQ